MPAHDLVEAAPQQRRIEGAGQAQRRRDVVGRGPGRELIEEPEALLGEGERRLAGPRARHQGQSLRAARSGHPLRLDVPRQGRHRRRLEDLADGDVDPEGAAHP